MNCNYCTRPLEDHECVFCTHTSPIRNAIACLFPPTQIVEVRALRSDGGSPVSGLYTDHVRMAEDIAALSADPNYKSVYTTLNPIKREWLDAGNMSVNCLRRNVSTTKDSDIESRTHLLLDFDPKRPSNTSSTGAELCEAEQLMSVVREYLTGLGWPSPYVASSGNGYHLLYSLPNLEVTREVDTYIEFALRALSAMFSNDTVTVDVAVGNRSRICKAYGTITRKGVKDGSRPWRESRINNPRELVTPVTLEQLMALAKSYSKYTKPTFVSEEPCLNPDFDVEDLIEHFGLDVTGSEQKGDSTYYYLAECPFVGRAHSGDPRKTALVVGNNLGFKCFSDECEDNHIIDFLRVMSEEHGRFPGDIWPDVDITDFGGDEDAVLPADEPTKITVATGIADTPTLEFTVETAPATPTGVALPDSSYFTDDLIPPPRRVKTPYVTPENHDDSKYPFPPEALYGWLGKKTLELDLPLGLAYPAMLTVWAGLGIDTLDEDNYVKEHPSPPPTLYTVLIAGPGAGKSVAIDRALRTIPPLSPRFRKTSITASDRGILTLFKPGKNDPVSSSGKPDSFLLIQDEFKSTLSKIGAPGSSLASTFCSMYYNSECGVSDKTGTHDISAWVSILGGLPAEDEAEFSEYFGSETTNGLYSRFIYGVGPKTWRFNFRWKENPEQRWPTQVYVGDLAHDVAQAWVDEGYALGRNRGRLAEKALRVATISASANGDTEITQACMDAAMAFARWQESIVDTHRAGVSETVDGKIQSAIEDTLEGLRVDGVSNWVNFWDLARRKNWPKKYGSSTVTRLKKSMIEDKTLIEEMYESDEGGKKRPTGYIRLRNKAGVKVEPSEKFKLMAGVAEPLDDDDFETSKKPKRTREEFRITRNRNAGEKSIGGSAAAPDNEVSTEV